MTRTKPHQQLVRTVTNISWNHCGLCKNDKVGDDIIGEARGELTNPWPLNIPSIALSSSTSSRNSEFSSRNLVFVCWSVLFCSAYCETSDNEGNFRAAPSCCWVMFRRDESVWMFWRYCLEWVCVSKKWDRQIQSTHFASSSILAWVFSYDSKRSSIFL